MRRSLKVPTTIQVFHEAVYYSEIPVTPKNIEFIFVIGSSPATFENTNKILQPRRDVHINNFLVRKVWLVRGGKISDRLNLICPKLRGRHDEITAE